MGGVQRENDPPDHLLVHFTVEDDVGALSAGTWALITFRKRMNSWCRWRAMLRPMAVPSSTFSAANRVVVPPDQSPPPA